MPRLKETRSLRITLKGVSLTLFFCLFLSLASAASASNSAPTIDSVSPSNSSCLVNSPINLTTTFSDADGWQDIQTIYFLINTSTNSSKCLCVYYNSKTNQLYMKNDDSSRWLVGTLGSANSIENSYVKLDCAKTVLSGSGPTLTVNWSITFQSPFLGTKNIYLYVKDYAGTSQGWLNKGTITIQAQIPAAPLNLTATTLSTTEIRLDWQDNSDNEDGFKIERSSSASGPFTQIDTIGAKAITYRNSGLAPHTSYFYRIRAYNVAGDSGYTNVVSARTANSAATIDSVSPQSSSCTANSPINLTTTFSDADGWQDIQTIYFLINTSTNSSKCLCVYYNSKTNQLYMKNDDSSRWLVGTLGSANSIENSYVKLDCAKTVLSGSGPTLTVNWSITFQSPFLGTKNIYLYVKDYAGTSQGWLNKGTITIQAEPKDNIPPTITTQPQSQTVNLGSSVTFSIASTGTAPLAYQWQKKASGAADFTNITSATNSAYTFTPLAGDNEAQFRCIVTNSAGSVTSSAVGLTVNVTQTITSSITGTGGSISPSGVVSVNYNASQDFTITAGSGYNINQVLVDGAAVSFTASPYTYTFTNVTANHTIAASFVVQASSPVITMQPSSPQTVKSGNNVTLNIEATGTAPLTYQWRKDGTNLANGGRVSGADTATLTIATAVDTDAGSYSCLVTNSAGSAVSAGVILTVDQPPSITTQPVDQTVSIGSQANFSIAATGTAPLTYQWQKKASGAADFTSISSATNSAYTFTPQAADNAAQFRCVVTNSAGSATSNAANLAVTVTLTINTQNGTVGKKVGGQATTATTFNAGTIVELTAAPNTGYSFSSWSGDLSGSAATTTITMDANKAVIANFTLQSQAPTITTQPQSQTVNLGSSVSFSIASTGTAPLAYQWQKKASGAADFTNISAATSSNYAFIPLVTDNAAQFRCIVTNSAGSATSNAANLAVTVTLTITAQNGTVTRLPQGTQVNGVYAYPAGTLVTLTAVPSTGYLFTNWSRGLTGSTNPINITLDSNKTVMANFTLQAPPTAPSNLTAATLSTTDIRLYWQDNSDNEDGFNIERSSSASGPFSQIGTIGANSTTCKNYGLTLNTIYYYRICAYNAYGNSGYSNVVSGTTTIVSSQSPTITTQPASQTVSIGNQANFSIAATGTAPLAYQWQKKASGAADFTGITSATNSAYTFTPQAADNAAQFRCIVTNSAGSATSNAANLTVTVTLTLTAQNGTVGKKVGGQATTATTFNAGTIVELTAAPNTGYSFSSWSGDLSGSAATTTITMDANKAVIANFSINTFTITASIGQNGSISPSGAVSVNYNASQAFIITANSGYNINQVLVDGAAVNFTASPYTYTFTNVIANHTIAASFVVQPSSPSITTQPVDQTVSIGNQANFSIAATGTAPLAYQWQKKASGAADFTSISSATNSAYTFTPQAADNAAQFRCVVTNSAGSVISSPATLTLQVTITASVGQGGSITPSGAVNVNYGASQAFTVAANTGYNISQVFVDSSVVTLSSGKYIFTNLITNHTISVSFTQILASTITIQPSNQAVILGNTATFSLTATGTAPLTYQWQEKVPSAGVFTNISAATSSSYAFTPQAADNAAQFRCIVTNPAGSVTSNAAGLTVKVALTVNATNGSILKNPDQADYNLNDTVVLTASPNTGYSFTNWSGDATGATNPTTITMDANKTVTANFILSPSGQLTGAEGGEVSSPDGKVKVIIPPGALNEPTRIEILNVNKETLQTVTPSGTSLLSVVECKPYGLVFKNTVQVSYVLDQSEIPGTPVELGFYDSIQKKIISTGQTSTVPVNGYTVNFSIMHFSTYAALKDSTPQSVPIGGGVKIPLPDLLTGSFSHAIPITVPPGRKGIQPQLALSYRSSNPNSWVGVGFSLNTGYIVRSTRLGPPKYIDNQDTFYFITDAGSTELVNLIDNLYQAKVESSFTKFFKEADDSWRAVAKDGTALRFGQTSDSKETSSKGTFAWYLTKATDTNGNYIEYSYAKDQGKSYLSRIDYTGNDNGVSPTNSVEFSLESRGDVPSSYISTSRIATARRLKEIRVKVGSDLVWRYALEYSYSPDTNRSFLKSITQAASDDKSLPTQTLTYQQAK